jgi:hypothetical protein
VSVTTKIQTMVMTAFGVAIAIEGAYMVSLQRSVSTLGVPRTAAAPEDDSPLDRPAAMARAAPSRAPLPARAVPVFTTAASAPGQGAVLDSLGSPEGRQRLAEVLTAMKEQRRQDKFIQANERREQLNRRLHESIGPALALNPDETHKARALLASLSTASRQAITEIQSGLKSRAEAKQELDGTERTVDAGLKELLGDKRMTALKELRKNEDRALRSSMETKVK